MAEVFWLKLGATARPVHRGDCILGRSPACFMVLPSEKVSRQHAVVRYERGTLTIGDLGSRNGTRLNGTKVEGPLPLKEGDKIEIGKDVIEVELREGRDLPQTVDEGPDEANTRAQQQSILELAEELVEQAAESKRRREIARTIQRLIDTYIEDVDKRGSRLSGSESIRLLSVARVVTGWAGDSSLDDWCAEVTRSAGGLPTRAPSMGPDGSDE